MGIRTRCESKVAVTSAMMVQLMKWEDAPAENQKRQEHVSQDCTTHEKYIRTC